MSCLARSCLMSSVSGGFCAAHFEVLPVRVRVAVVAAVPEAASAAVGYIVLLEGGKLRVVEVKALIAYGYGRWVEAEYVRRYGEEKRMRIKEQLAKLALGDR